MRKDNQNNPDNQDNQNDQKTSFFRINFSSHRTSGNRDADDDRPYLASALGFAGCIILTLFIVGIMALASKRLLIENFLTIFTCCSVVGCCAGYGGFYGTLKIKEKRLKKKNDNLEEQALIEPKQKIESTYGTNLNFLLTEEESNEINFDPNSEDKKIIQVVENEEGNEINFDPDSENKKEEEEEISLIRSPKNKEQTQKIEEEKHESINPDYAIEKKQSATSENQENSSPEFN